MVARSALPLPLLLLTLAGCASAPPLPPPPPPGVDAALEARLPPLAKRLAEIAGPLARLPRVARWSQERFRAYLLERWAKRWPVEVAKEEERILQALKLWPRGRDYRAETLESIVSETVAAYLEERDWIVVIGDREVADRTLVHELAHARQRERWGELPEPRTFSEQFWQDAAREGQAYSVEIEFAGESLEDFLARYRAAMEADRGPPAWRWLGLEPAYVGVQWGAPDATAFAFEERTQGDVRGGQDLGRQGVAAWLRALGLEAEAAAFALESPPWAATGERVRASVSVGEDSLRIDVAGWIDLVPDLPERLRGVGLQVARADRGLRVTVPLD